MRYRIEVDVNADEVASPASITQELVETVTADIGKIAGVTGVVVSEVVVVPDEPTE